MLFAAHAFFISKYSYFIIGIIDKQMHTKISISSVLILKIFKGEHKSLIVLAKPCNSGGFGIYKCYITYKY